MREFLASMNRIVLAYSGGLVTSVAIPWLADKYDAEIVTMTLDLGQGVELSDVRERALAAGAVRAHVIDAREEFVRDYILPALQAGALRSDRSLGTELSRPLIAKRLVGMARMESASPSGARLPLQRRRPRQAGRGNRGARTGAADPCPSV